MVENNMGILITMLFNLGLELNLKFKQCKYCNNTFIVWHNRQVHCSDKCRKKYKYSHKTQKRFEKRIKAEPIKFIDHHGNFNAVKPDQLKRLGSMNSNLGAKPMTNFEDELKAIEGAIDRMGIRKGNHNHIPNGG